MYAHVNTITSIFVCFGQNADARFLYKICEWEKKKRWKNKNYYEKSTYKYDEILSSFWNGLTMNEKRCHHSKCDFV